MNTAEYAAAEPRIRTHLLDAIFLFLYRQRLRRSLRQYGGAFGRAVIQEIIGRAAALVIENQRRLVDRASGSHLWMSATVTATYQVLMAHPVTRDEALRLTREAWLCAGAAPPAWAMRLLPRVSRDPFRFVVNVSKKKQAQYYGATFSRRVEQDDDSAYRMTVTGCFYHRFLVENGVPELGPMFCEKDFDWAGAIVPEVHGFSFSRPTTLLTGGTSCPFELQRVRPRAGGIDVASVLPLSAPTGNSTSR